MPAGDTLHLLHVVPEPSMVHVWPGMYVPPDDDAEQDEVTLHIGTSRQDIHTDMHRLEVHALQNQLIKP